MAEKNFMVGEPIEILYQAPNKESGLTGVVAEIYLPNGQKDSAFPDVELMEMGSTGNYRGSFTPDEDGEWSVICHKAGGDGQVSKRYSVGDWNVHEVGEGVSTVDGKVNVVDSKITGVDGKANSIITKIDEIDTKVSALDTPPMVS